MKFLNQHWLSFYKKSTIITMSILYIIVGIKHFISPQYFISITPPFIPYAEEVVCLTGVIEILGGILILMEETRTYGARLLVFLLIVVFPANIYLYISEDPRHLIGISQNQALLRIPFQIPLIMIAIWHSQKASHKYLEKACVVLFPVTIIYFLSL